MDEVKLDQQQESASAKNHLNFALNEALAGLNPEQKKAVENIDGPMMVLAGPGTGKTQILTLRIARILQETQMEPRNILCLTFTESGAAAMRRRLASLLGEAAYGVRIHTFHSFCNDLIQSDPSLFLASKDLEVLDDLEQFQWFREFLDELPEEDPIKPFAAPYCYETDLKKHVHKLKSEDITPIEYQKVLQQLDDFLNRHNDQLTAFAEIHGAKLKAEEVRAVAECFESTPYFAINQDLDPEEKKSRTAYKNRVKSFIEDSRQIVARESSVLKVYKRYTERLKQCSRYDYEDMLLRVIAKMKSEPLWTAKLREQYQYILVDEYQDTNGAQNALLKELLGDDPNPNCFVVGDDKQSIYRFQGASIENMLSFYMRYKSSIQTVTLQENYRSQQSVLDAATLLIRHNETGLAQQMDAEAQHLISKVNLPQKPLKVLEATNVEEEEQAILEAVQTLITGGENPSEIAILVRNNKDAINLGKRFEKNDIAVHIHVKKNILDLPLLKTVRNILKTLANPQDDNVLFKVLHSELWGIDPLLILKWVREWNALHWEAKNAGEKISLIELLGQKKEAQFFIENWKRWRAGLNEMLITELFEKVLAESGLVTKILTQEDRAEQLRYLNTFFEHMKLWIRKNPKKELESFLDTLDLMEEVHVEMEVAEMQTKNRAVNIMTAHSSKGLEFNHVFIPHLVDKHWSNVASQEKLKWPLGLLKTASPTMGERNEEERRLFYVALTRARQTVTLSWAAAKNTDKAQVPAQFLLELGDENIKKESAHVSTPLEKRWELNLLPTRRQIQNGEKMFAEELLKDYQMSVTHLNNYLECPLKFYYENLLRIPRTKNKSQAFGTAIHDALYEVFLKHLSKSSEGRIEEALQAFDRSLSRELVHEKDREAVRQFGHSTLKDYLKNEDQNIHAEKLYLLEYNFRSHHVQVEGVPITGKLDKIEILDSVLKTAKVVDYKTGNPDTHSKELSTNGGTYSRQLAFYQLLCDHSKEFPYKMVQGEIDFVQRGRRTQLFKKHTINISSIDKERVLTELKSTYEDIQNLIFLEPNPDSCCMKCEGCAQLTRYSPTQSV